MNHSYTRQPGVPENACVFGVERQGRDFSILNALAAAEMSIEGNYNNIDGIIGNGDNRDDSAMKKTMLEQLEYFQAVAERNRNRVKCADATERERFFAEGEKFRAAPIDGNEPNQERGR